MASLCIINLDILYVQYVRYAISETAFEQHASYLYLYIYNLFFT